MVEETISKDRFKGLEYAASELSAYLITMDTCILSLKNGQVVHHKVTDADKDAFKAWLEANHIRDISCTLVYKSISF